MNRRLFLLSMAAGLALPGALRADAISDPIVAELRRQGFGAISVEKTWLGRLRIVASGADGQREIVVNPQTGEILRDVWQGRSGGSGILGDRSGGGRSGRGSEAPPSGTAGSGTSGSGTSGSGSSGTGGSGSGRDDDRDDRDDDRDDRDDKDDSDDRDDDRSGSGSGSSGSGGGSDDSGDDKDDDKGGDD